MSKFLPPASEPLPEPEKLDPADAGSALVNWFNAQGIKRAEAMLVMSKVAAKITADTTSPLTAATLSDNLDKFVVQVAADINDYLYRQRSAIRFNRKPPTR